MYADELQAVLVANTFDLVAQVVKVALADALRGEGTSQEFLDCVAPDWRERRQRVKATIQQPVAIVFSNS